MCGLLPLEENAFRYGVVKVGGLIDMWNEGVTCVDQPASDASPVMEIDEDIQGIRGARRPLEEVECNEAGNQSTGLCLEASESDDVDEETRKERMSIVLSPQVCLDRDTKASGCLCEARECEGLQYPKQSVLHRSEVDEGSL